MCVSVPTVSGYVCVCVCVCPWVFAGEREVIELLGAAFPSRAP